MAFGCSVNFEARLASEGGNRSITFEDLAQATRLQQTGFSLFVTVLRQWPSSSGVKLGGHEITVERLLLFRPRLSEVLLKVRSLGKRVSDEQQGQSLIEFTLVMPILLLIMTGMLSFGFALHNYMVLTNGVNAGAQLLAISRGQTSDPCATASAAVQSTVLGLTTANLSYTFVINGTTYTTTSCTAGAANMVQGAPAEVAATYPCTLAIFGMHIPSCNLQAQFVELIQ